MHGKKKQRSASRLSVGEAAREIRRCAGSGARTLGQYWRIGKVVASLEGGYGTSAVEGLARQLAGVKGLQVSTLAKARRVASVLSEAEARRLERAGVSWKSATALSSHFVPAGRREGLIKRVLGGRLKASRLGPEAARYRDEAALARPRAIAAAGKNAAKAIEILWRVAENGNLSIDAREAALRTLADLHREAGSRRRKSSRCGDCGRGMAGGEGGGLDIEIGTFMHPSVAGAVLKRAG